MFVCVCVYTRIYYLLFSPCGAVRGTVSSVVLRVVSVVAYLIILSPDAVCYETGDQFAEEAINHSRLSLVARRTLLCVCVCVCYYSYSRCGNACILYNVHKVLRVHKAAQGREEEDKNRTHTHTEIYRVRCAVHRVGGGIKICERFAIYWDRRLREMVRAESIVVTLENPTPKTFNSASVSVDYNYFFSSFRLLITLYITRSFILYERIVRDFRFTSLPLRFKFLIAEFLLRLPALKLLSQLNSSPRSITENNFVFSFRRFAANVDGSITFNGVRHRSPRSVMYNSQNRFRKKCREGFYIERAKL